MAKPARFEGRRRQRRSVWRTAKWYLLLGGLLGGWWLLKDRLTPPEPQDTVSLSFRLCGEAGRGPCVIDGDTLAIGQRRVRLTGYDAPELDGACAAEVAKAQEARAALRDWLAEGAFTWTGGDEPPRDRYGRELREARRGDDALAEHMVEVGLAEGNGWGAERREWC